MLFCDALIQYCSLLCVLVLYDMEILPVRKYLLSFQASNVNCSGNTPIMPPEEAKDCVIGVIMVHRPVIVIIST